MNYKKIMLASFVLLAIITLGAVSASQDIASDDALVVEDGQVSIDDSADELSSSSNLDSDKELKTVGDSNNNIIADGDKGTFEDIRTLINNTAENGVVELSGEYVGDASFIEISKPLTINGNGATIDANGEGSIFEVYSSDVIIKDITFKNSVALNVKFIQELDQDGVYGSAVLIGDNSGVEIINCTFINCSAQEGSAVWAGSDCSISNCTFMDCYSGFNSAAIHLYEQISYSIESCKFINCVSENNGGAVYAFNSREGTIRDCNFSDCSSPWGGAIIADNGIHNITNCIFTDCSGVWGGAINFFNANAVIADCTFVRCSARNGGEDVGGAINFRGDQGDYLLNNSLFRNCVANDGGAVKNDESSLLITQSNFTDCEAENGAAVYSDVVVDVADCVIRNCTASSEGIQGAFNNVNYTDCYLDGEYLPSGEVINNNPGIIDVGFWDENDERGTLYTDSVGYVVYVDVMDGSEGTIFIIVNDDDEHPFSWNIECDEGEDFPYHQWNLQDLEIFDAGEYNITVKCNDEVIANSTLNVNEYDYNTFRAVMDDYNVRLYCPENALGYVRIVIEGYEDDGENLLVLNTVTTPITVNDSQKWIEWNAGDLNVSNEVWYHIKVEVLDDDDNLLYNVSQWNEFGDSESGIYYDGDEYIIAYDDGKWKTANYFYATHIDEEYAELYFYINCADDWDPDPTYYFNLTGKAGYFIYTLEDLGITEVGEYDVQATYDWGYGSVDLNIHFTIYEPQIVTDVSYEDIGGKACLTMEILPIPTIITGNVYDDWIIRLNGTFDDYEGRGTTIDITIYNESSVRLNSHNLTVAGQYAIIGSKDLGITKEGNYVIKVDCIGPRGNTISLTGNITYWSNVKVNLDMYNLRSESLHYGYGLDDNSYIEVKARNQDDYPFENIEGNITIYIDGKMVRVFDVKSLDSLGWGNYRSYYVPASKLPLSEGNHTITVIYEGKEATVEETQNFTAVILTAETVYEYGGVKIAEDIYSESVAPVIVEFWGNPMNADPMIWGKYVVYVDGEKINKTHIVFFNDDDPNSDTSITYDINSDEAAEMMDKIHHNQLPGWDYDIYDWLQLAHMIWHCNNTVVLSLDDLNITTEGIHTIAVKYYGENLGSGEDLELLRKDINYTINPDYAKANFDGAVVKYKDDNSAVFTFDFGENIFNESNRVIIYVDGALAYNSTVLYSAQNENITGELNRLLKVPISSLNPAVLNKYGWLDEGTHEAFVYLVKGEGATPIEIGKGNFTVSKQKGVFNITIVEESGHAYLYVDIPENDWTDFCLAVNIADSEEIWPNHDMDMWNNEYVIFKDNQIILKEDLEDLIDKGPLTIDLGVLDENTHVWVQYEYGEIYVHLERDFYRNDFTVNEYVPYVPVDPELAIDPISDVEEGTDVLVVVSANETFNGVVSVLVGDNVVAAVEMVNGSGSVTLDAGNFTIGENTIKVTSSASEFFTAGEASVKFNVTEIVVPTPVDPELAIAPISDVEEGTDVLVVVSANETFNGVVSVLVGDNVVASVEMVNGSGSVTITAGNFTIGENTIKVTSSASEFFTAGEASVKFNVTEIVVPTPVDPALAIAPISDVEEGSDVLVVVSANETFNGIVAVLVGDNVVAAIDMVNGSGSVTLGAGNFTIGENTIKVTSSASELFTVGEATVKFNVTKTVIPTLVDSALAIAPISDVEEGADVLVVVSANETFNGVVSVLVGDNVVASVDMVNGSGSVTITAGNFTIGENTIKVTSSASELFTAGEATVKFNVTKTVVPPALVDPALTISVADITEGANAIVIINTNATFSGNVSVQIGNDNYTVAVINGTGSISVSGLKAGNYTATATLKATDVFDASIKNTTFTVKAKIATVLNASTVTTTYGTSKKLVVTLTDAKGNVLAGKNVVIILNGVKHTIKTDSKGKASLNIGTKLNVKTYSASITFGGDANYAASTKSVKVVVKKAKPKLTAKNKAFKVKKPKKYTVILKTDKGKVMKKVKVALTIKNKKIKLSVKTTSKGKATFNLKKLTKKGKYTATVKFAGDKNYKKVSKKVTITVK